MIYSYPNSNDLFGYAFLTSIGIGILAIAAKALEAAIFIYSLIWDALTSNAALNKNGKHITLLIWFG